MECRKHKENYLTRVCAQCRNEPVCGKCLAGLHKGHTTANVSESVTAVQTYLQGLTTQNKSIMSSLNCRRDEIAKIQKQEQNGRKEMAQQIHQKRDFLYKLIDEASDEILNEYTEKWNKNNEILQEHFNLLSQAIVRGETFDSNIEELLKQEGFEIIQGAFNLEPFSPTVDIPTPTAIRLNENPDSLKEVKNMFGNMSELTARVKKENTSEKSDDQQMQVDLISEFSHSNTVDVISGYSEGLCYFKHEDDNEITIIDEEGRLHGRFEYGLAEDSFGFDSNPDGNIYVSCQKPNSIKRIAFPSGTVVPLFSTRDLVPDAVCRISTGEILVALWNESARDSWEEREGMLIKFNETGKQLAMVKKDMFGTNLFNRPIRLRINQSEDTLAVVNQVTSEFSNLVLLDQFFRVKLRYLGKGRVTSGTTRFTPPDPEKQVNIANIFDAVFDSQNNILICEKNTRSLQKLNSKCEVLQILYEFDCTPFSLAINCDGRIWVGAVNGTVYVLKYTKSSGKKTIKDDKGGL